MASRKKRKEKRMGTTVFGLGVGTAAAASVAISWSAITSSSSICAVMLVTYWLILLSIAELSSFNLYTCCQKRCFLKFKWSAWAYHLTACQSSHIYIPLSLVPSHPPLPSSGKHLVVWIRSFVTNTFLIRWAMKCTIKTHNIIEVKNSHFLL